MSTETTSIVASNSHSTRTGHGSTYIEQLDHEHEHEQVQPPTIPKGYVAATEGSSECCCKDDPWSCGCISRPKSTSSRLIIDFFPVMCCSSGPGVRPSISSVVPGELSLAGVSASDWRYFMVDRLAQVQERAAPGGMMGCCLSIITIFTIPCLCARFFSYQRALADWLHDFNETVLKPKGLFASTQVGLLDIGGKYREERSWLSIALTREESLVLSEEGHFFVYQCGCRCADLRPCQGSGCTRQPVFRPMPECCNKAGLCCGPIRYA